MEPHTSAPIAVRTRRMALFLVPTLVVLSTVGCGGHRRSSLRPVYVSPAPAATVVPGGCQGADCGPTTTIGPRTTVTPGGGEESITSTPSAEPGPAIETPFGGSSNSPSSPPSPNEPPLELEPSSPAGKGASLVKPQKSSAQKNRRSPTVRLRQAGLSNELRSYVNDPEDLFLPPKSERPWKYVVLHHSANPEGNYDQIDREHRKTLGWNGCGYHFIIGNGTGSPDGQIEVSQRWSNQKHGVHCRNGKTPEVNEYGIGICLVGDLDDKPPTPRQIAAAKALVSYLGERYSIPTDHMGSHAQLANSPTACPGKHFPAQAILGSRNLALR